MEFTNEQLAIVRAFLHQVRERAEIDREDWMEACQAWPRSLRIWGDVYGFSGPEAGYALWWYRYRHKPKSKEWRPVIILRALVLASERDYVEPGKIELSDAILCATPHQKGRAKMAFIRRFGVDAFRLKVRPILRLGGTEALSGAPATQEVREYVAILTGLASKTL